MKNSKRTILLLAGLGLALLGLSGCSSSGYPANVSTSVGYSYGPGYYDPWYHHGYGYYGGGAVIVNPPAHRPPGGNRPGNLPSMPSTPRPRPR